MAARAASCTAIRGPIDLRRHHLAKALARGGWTLMASAPNWSDAPHRPHAFTPGMFSK